MWQEEKFIVQGIVLLIVIPGLTNARKYTFHTENEEVFTECTEKMDGNADVVDVHGLCDRSELKNNITDAFEVMVWGNFTLTWDIQQSDRVEASFALYRFERSQWKKTMLSIEINDFCKVLYDKNQVWYKYWTQYVTNADDVKDKCLNVPGTKVMHRPFETELILDFPGFSMEGLHKVVVIFKAFDEQRVQQGPTVCTEILGMIEPL